MFCPFCCRLWIFYSKNWSENSCLRQIVRNGVSLCRALAILADPPLSCWVVPSGCRFRDLLQPFSVSLVTEEQTIPCLLSSVSLVSWQFLPARLVASWWKCNKSISDCVMIDTNKACFNVDFMETMTWPKDSLSRTRKGNLSNRKKNNTAVVSQPVGLNLVAEKKKKRITAQKRARFGAYVKWVGPLNSTGGTQ